MSPEQENFDQLRRLLAIKKHEQPPPGYFNHFSGNVIARIRAGEAEPVSFAERLAMAFPWLSRMANFQISPAVAGGFGVAVCGFLVFAGLNTDSVAEGPQSNVLSAGTSLQLAVPARISAQMESPSTLGGGITGANGTRTLPVQSPFLQPASQQSFQPVLYTVPGH